MVDIGMIGSMVTQQTYYPDAVPLPLYSKEKAMEKLNAKCKVYDDMEYHPLVKKLIPEL